MTDKTTTPAAKATTPAIARVVMRSDDPFHFGQERDSTLRTLMFDDVDVARAFARDFGTEYVPDGNGHGVLTVHVDPVAKANETTKLHVLYGLSIENGRYVSRWELVSGYEAYQDVAALKAAIESPDPSAAFAVDKNGNLRKLEGDNVGVLTYYSRDDLADELNDD